MSTSTEILKQALEELQFLINYPSIQHATDIKHKLDLAIEEMQMERSTESKLKPPPFARLSQYLNLEIISFVITQENIVKEYIIYFKNLPKPFYLTIPSLLYFDNFKEKFLEFTNKIPANLSQFEWEHLLNEALSEATIVDGEKT